MKTTKKILFGLGVALLGNFAANAQGLQNIYVEKYYKTDANDAANALAQGSSSPLNAGNVVYRVYVQMAPNYKFVQMFGNANHDWKINTSTVFFNDPNNGSAVGPQGTSLTNTKKNTVLIDSWLTTAGVCAGKVGIPKNEDTDGSIGNTQGILANNPGGAYGLPINGVGAQDGLTAGSPIVPTALGLNNQDAIFDQTPGGSFLVNGGSIAALGGAVGTGTANSVLIGQFTTDGVFGFEFNVQVLNSVTGVAEIYVAKNPQPGETVFAGLTLAPPTCNITSPVNGANFVTGSLVNIGANATASGTITQVQFFVDGTSVGTDLSSPFTATYTAANGSHTINAIATDNTGATATSTNVVISVAANQVPVVTVAAPLGAVTGDIVTFTATANDPDGTVASVSFSVDNVAIGTVASSPYTYTWTAAFGSHNVKASATDNLGAVGVSAPVSFNVVNNIPPSVTITSPLPSAAFTAPQVVTITANASDADGTVTQVEFFVNNVSIGVVTSAPYTYTWTSVIGNAAITVKATDNKGAITTSSALNLSIANPNALPYAIGAVKQKCTQSTFCLPISAATTYTADNVIGYDIVLNYDQNKVTPTGNITVNNAMVTPSIVSTANTFTNGVMNISVYFNTNAPGNAEFTGNGEIICVEFNKNGSFNPVDTANFSVSSLQESYATGVTPKLTSAADYTTYKDTMFNASLKFWLNNGPVAYNAGNPNDYLITNVYGSSPSCVTNTMAAPVQPNLNGDFTYNILNGSSISIDRDVLPATIVQPVINGFDFALVRQLLLNTATFVPTVYQAVAADVNLDGVISAGDASQINQRATNAIPEFKQAWNYNAAGSNTLGVNSKDYVFIDSLRIQNNPAYAISSTFPLDNLVGYSKSRVPVTPFCLPVTVQNLAICPAITHETYKAVMVGDVNGNSATVAGTLQLRPNGDKVVFDLSKSIVKGTSVEVPVSFVSSRQLIAVDFATKFDASISYNTMVNYPSSTEAFAYFNPNDKTLRFTSANLSGYDANQPVAYIRFETTNGVIEADQLNSLEGYLNGDQVAVEVLDRTTGIHSQSANSAVNVYPNPTSGILNITSATDAKVELTDISGKEVLLQTTVSASKNQQINVSNLNNGVYILKVSSNDSVVIKKVVLNK